MDDINKFCRNKKLNLYECLSLGYLMNKLKKHQLLTTASAKNKENMINYLNNHLYIYLGKGRIDNRFFPFNLKRFGFIYNTTEIIPQYTYLPGNQYFQLKAGNRKFFTSFYKLTETNTEYIIQIDTIYVALETDRLFDNKYISKTPNQKNTDSIIYFYYKSGNYDGIASIITATDFPPYEEGDTSNTIYFIRKKGVLPKNRMELLSGYKINEDDNIITFEDEEECEIVESKILSSWKDNVPEVVPEIGDIVYSVKIELTK